MGALFSRVKTWVSTEDVSYSDLNAEFDNILTYLTPAYVDDYSANVSQMQSTADPGEVGTESLATSTAGEFQRLRKLIAEITGEDEWYESPVSSLLGLANAIGTGLTDNRLVSGKVRTTSAQPVFLDPDGAAKTVYVRGATTNFIYYINGIEYTISTDVSLTGLTAAPSSNNTCLVNDAVAADQYWTKYTGEDGTEIPIDTVGTEITSLVGKFAAFKLDNGSTTEYFTAYVASSTSLTKVKRGYFFDSSDAPIPRIVYSNNDTITLMKLTWVFAKTDGTLTATYTNPVWSDDEPSSPAIGDYWFDYSVNKWKVYGVGSYSVAGAVLIGVCIQDTTNTVAARSLEFFKNYAADNTVEVNAESNTQVKSKHPGSFVNVWGTSVKNDHNLHTWDMTLDLESGVTEAPSTYYFFYITETGDKIISDKKPYDRNGDLAGFYHPHHSWRCVGFAFNNGSSNLSDVNSYYRYYKGDIFRPIATADLITGQDDTILCDTSGGAFTLTIPAASTLPGKKFKIKKTSSADANALTLSVTVDGTATPKLYAPYETWEIESNNSAWNLMQRYVPQANIRLHVDSGNGHGSTNTKVRRFSNSRENTLSPYATYEDSATLGASVTIAIPGLYHIVYADVQAGSYEEIGITLNGSALTTNIDATSYAQGRRASSEAAATILSQVSAVLWCTVGDILRPQSNGQGDSTGADVVLSVTKVG